MQLFQYPPRSAPALLAGTLLLKYCTVRFASEVPTWRLLVSGHAAGLVTAERGVVDGGGAEVGNEEVHWVSGSGPGGKRIRLNRKNPAHLVGRSVIQSRPRVWKRLRHVCIQLFPLLIVRGGVMISKTRVCSCATRDWGGMIPGARLQVCTRRISR